MKYKYACPGCLKEMFTENIGYCSACRRHLFDNKSVPPTLPFGIEAIPDGENRMTLSIYRGKVRIDPAGEWILRPVPTVSGVRYISDIPANRHLMMRIADQIFGIAAAPSGMIYFKDGTPAHITRRFDIRKGETIPHMDFCSLAGLDQNSCEDIQTPFSYQKIAMFIKRFTPAATIELEKFFQQLVFNFMICNAKSYGNRFAFLQRESGDYGLAPAHDLLCTALHFETPFLLPLPLFDTAGEQKDAALDRRYTRGDFLKLARSIGLKERLAVNFMECFSQKKDDVFYLVERSFMSSAAKKIFKRYYLDRLYDISDTFGRPGRT